MNKWINKYFKTLDCLFPVMGKEEKHYLTGFRSRINDYFASNPPSSIEEISTVFGTPEEVSNKYLETIPPDEMLKKMRTSRRFFMIDKCMFIVLVIAIIIFSFQMWRITVNYFDIMDDAHGYFVEYIG